ncbi:tyrosine-type recombinase/integrase [Chloroflexota bacterium]
MDAQINAFLNELKLHTLYSANTQKAYAQDLSRFLNFMRDKFKRPPKSADLTITAIGDFLNSERKSGFKPSTLYRRRASIRRFAQFLVNRGVIEINLEEEKPFLKPKERRMVTGREKKIMSLADNEVQRLLSLLLEANNPRASRDLAILSLMLETGMSIGNLVLIDLSDLNLRNKLLRVSGLDEQDDWLEIPQASEPIQLYLVEGRPELTQSRSEMALFVSQMGGRISRQGVWQVLRKWGRKAKIKKGLSPRLIRHTAAKHMVEAGKSPEEIQRLLGHRNLFSTLSLVRRLKKTYSL